MDSLSLQKTDKFNAEFSTKEALSSLMKDLEVGTVDPISYSEDKVYCILNSEKSLDDKE